MVITYAFIHRCLVMFDMYICMYTIIHEICMCSLVFVTRLSRKGVGHFGAKHVRTGDFQPVLCFFSPRLYVHVILSLYIYIIYM